MAGCIASVSSCGLIYSFGDIADPYVHFYKEDHSVKAAHGTDTDSPAAYYIYLFIPEQNASYDL